MALYQLPEKRKRESSTGSSGGSIFGNRPLASFEPISTPEQAMKESTVFTCINILAQTIASLPKKVYYQDDKGNKRVAREHPLHDLLSHRPNSQMTGYTFWDAVMRTCLGFGNSYIEKVHDRAGRLVELWPILNEAAKPKLLNGELAYEMGTVDNKTVTVGLEKIFHLKMYSRNGYTGVSPIDYMLSPINSSKAADDLQLDYFVRGHVGGYFESTQNLGSEQLEDIRKQLSRFRSQEKRGEYPIFPPILSFKPMTISQKDAELISSKKISSASISAIYRVPPHMLNDYENAHFSNLEQSNTYFVQGGVMPYTTMIEQAVNVFLLGDDHKEGYFFKINIDGLLRGDTQTRFEAYQKGITSGMMTPNEARAKEDLTAKDGGDDLLFPLNTTNNPARLAGDQARKMFAPLVESAAGRLVSREISDGDKITADDKALSRYRSLLKECITPIVAASAHLDGNEDVNFRTAELMHKIENTVDKSTDETSRSHEIYEIIMHSLYCGQKQDML